MPYLGLVHNWHHLEQLSQNTWPPKNVTSFIDEPLLLVRILVQYIRIGKHSYSYEETYLKNHKKWIWIVAFKLFLDL